MKLYALIQFNNFGYLNLDSVYATHVEATQAMKHKMAKTIWFNSNISVDHLDYNEKFGNIQWYFGDDWDGDELFYKVVEVSTNNISTWSELDDDFAKTLNTDDPDEINKFVNYFVL